LPRRMVIHVDQSGDARTPVIVDRIRLLAQTRPGEVANRGDCRLS
jgi:hypothetical protein